MRAIQTTTYFKIIKDETLTYVGNRKLYVTLAKEDRGHTLIIDSREKRVAKRSIINPNHAYRLYTAIIESLGRYTHYATVYEIAAMALQLETFEECMFFIRHHNSSMGPQEILGLKFKYHFKCNPEIYDFKVADENHIKCIEIYFEANKQPLGSYVLIEDKNKVLFKFEPNQNYPGFSR
ncbi:MAG: hypothetical protein ACK50A_02265 [Sphingobacteriaceae bacterium]|jgi:hypothetical protein